MSESQPPTKVSTQDLFDSSERNEMSSGTYTKVAGVKGVEFQDPFSERVAGWFRDFAKALKASRVYAENNEMHQQFLERAHLGLTALLAETQELSLTVREDRILHGKDAVYINSDRQEGLPFIFYRNAFRRLTLVQGIDRDELLKLMRAITTDYSSFDYAGEDLVTHLWRLALPHLRYLTIDTMSLKAKEANQEVREEVGRIQGGIENIIAAIYQTDAPDEDLVAGVSITREDLEAYKDLQAESPEDLDMLDQATARAITDVDMGQLERLSAELLTENTDRLTRRMMDILVQMLFKERSSKESALTIELLQRLFDSMILAHRYSDATALLERLREIAENAEDMQQMHIARHLLMLFATPSRIAPVFNAFNDGYRSTSVTEMVDFLRALGPSITPLLLSALQNLSAPAHRRLFCELIVEFGVPDMNALMERALESEWFVVRDLLSLSLVHGLDEAAALIDFALKHEHPKVRAHAVGMLKGYRKGAADRLIAERLSDEDVDVRMAAMRVAARRKSVEATEAVERILNDENLLERGPRELRTLMAGYAAIAGTAAVPLLERLLNPGFLKSFTSNDAQIAAAFALASIGTEPAKAALSKGARSPRGKVREACKRALNKDSQRSDTTDDLLKERGATTGDVKAFSVAENKTPKTLAIPDATTNPADLLFTVTSGREEEEVDTAPEFNPNRILAQQPQAAPVNVHKSGPKVQWIDKPTGIKEELPKNLPGAYRAPVEAAPELPEPSPPNKPSSSTDIIMEDVPIEMPEIAPELDVPMEPPVMTAPEMPPAYMEHAEAPPRMPPQSASREEFAQPMPSSDYQPAGIEDPLEFNLLDPVTEPPAEPIAFEASAEPIAFEPAVTMPGALQQVAPMSAAFEPDPSESAFEYPGSEPVAPEPRPPEPKPFIAPAPPASSSTLEPLERPEPLEDGADRWGEWGSQDVPPVPRQSTSEEEEIERIVREAQAAALEPPPPQPPPVQPTQPVRPPQSVQPPAAPPPAAPPSPASPAGWLTDDLLLDMPKPGGSGKGGA